MTFVGSEHPRTDALRQNSIRVLGVWPLIDGAVEDGQAPTEEIRCGEFTMTLVTVFPLAS